MGIELDPDRHGLAVAMLASATQSGSITPQEASRVKFINGDAFLPRAFQGATVVYMLSNVFPFEVYEQAHAVPEHSLAHFLRMMYVAISNKKDACHLNATTTLINTENAARTSCFECDSPIPWSIYCTCHALGSISTLLRLDLSFCCMFCSCSDDSLTRSGLLNPNTSAR